MNKNADLLTYIPGGNQAHYSLAIRRRRSPDEGGRRRAEASRI